jgi:hypothetical protein
MEPFRLYSSKRPCDFCELDNLLYIALRTSSLKRNDNKNWFMKMTLGEKKNWKYAENNGV